MLINGNKTKNITNQQKPQKKPQTPQKPETKPTKQTKQPPKQTQKLGEKKQPTVARQRKLIMKKHIKQIEDSSYRSLLARTHLHQAVLLQVSSLCRGHVILSLLLLPILKEREERRCRNKMSPLPRRNTKGNKRSIGRYNHEQKPWSSFSCPSVGLHMVP